MKTYKVALLTLITILVVGCGGGGGGGGTSYVAPSVTSTTYSGSVQTVHYSDGSTAVNNATSSTDSWASDHVTKTTSYTYANGGANTAVETVTPTAGTPSYSINTQTITSTYGDGYTSTATNTATSSPVTWASDHITKTTTYTFANGGTNPVVATVNPTVSTPTLTAAVYPENWTTVGTVTAPTVSAKNNVYGDGYISTVEDGTLSKPFNQTTLSGQSITDPNKYVISPTKTYNLTWGVPDKSGPSYAALFPTTGSHITLSGPITMWGQALSGQCSHPPCANGATIWAPHPEVIDAWNKGWTGNGVNILMEDYLTQAHGITTTILANRYAIGSTIYGFNVPTGLGIYNFDGTVAAPASMVNLGVVNASYGANLRVLIGHAAPWTNAELNAAATAFTSTSNAVISRYTGVTGWSNINYTNAVITKAAGNDSIAANYEPLVKALAANASISNRLLVVGALNQAGFTSAPATITAYSNKAGTDTTVQSRFLVASGTTPFLTGDIAVNGIAVSATTSTDPNGVALGNVGTSYAAPRVAGYTAIVMSKFPNLDAVKTSSIMLDTARYDTLSCNPNCDPAIYGKGEASLARALAPVGRLR